MKKVICFGAGGGAIHLYNDIIKKYDVVAFADNAAAKHGTELFGKKIIAVEEMKKMDFDSIVITSVSGQESITRQLLGMGFSENQIIPPSFITGAADGRIEFLRTLAVIHSRMDICDASVAEAGVFEGEFAQYINKVYPDRRCHLFDTFEGFPEQDIEKEFGLSEAAVGEFSHTSEAVVMQKMIRPENVIIHKGIFPETAVNEGGGGKRRVLLCQSRHGFIPADLGRPAFFCPSDG